MFIYTNSHVVNRTYQHSVQWNRVYYILIEMLSQFDDDQLIFYLEYDIASERKSRIVYEYLCRVERVLTNLINYMSARVQMDFAYINQSVCQRAT